MWQSYFKDKKVSIPGGAGFFGSHIKAKLDGVAPEIFIPRTDEGVDFREYSHCLSHFEKTKPDIVINCAAKQGGIAYHSGKQADIFKDNLLMNTFLMEAAQKTGVKKFVNIVPGCAYPGYLEKEEMNEEDFWNGKKLMPITKAIRIIESKKPFDKYVKEYREIQLKYLKTQNYKIKKI